MIVQINLEWGTLAQYNIEVKPIGKRSNNKTRLQLYEALMGQEKHKIHLRWEIRFNPTTLIPRLSLRATNVPLAILETSTTMRSHAPQTMELDNIPLVHYKICEPPKQIKNWIVNPVVFSESPSVEGYWTTGNLVNHHITTRVVTDTSLEAGDLVRVSSEPDKYLNQRRFVQKQPPRVTTTSPPPPPPETVSKTSGMNTRVSKYGPKFQLQDIINIEDEFVEYSGLSLATETWSSYRTAFRSFKSFCQVYNIASIFPIQAKVLIKYVKYLANVRKIRLGTITQYLTGLKKFHELQFHTTASFSNEMLKITLKGIENYQKCEQIPPKPRRAFTFSVLKLFGHRLGLLNLEWELGQIVWVIILIGFWGAVRLGALVVGKNGPDYVKCPRVGHISIIDDNHIILQLGLPKNGAPAEKVHLFRFDNPMYCPITQLKSLLQHRASVNKFDFIFTKPDGNLITGAEVNQIMQNVLDPAIINISGYYRGHSLRAGLPSTMAMHPKLFSKTEIKLTGRWASEAVERYCRLTGDTNKKTINKLHNMFDKK